MSYDQDLANAEARIDVLTQRLKETNEHADECRKTALDELEKNSQERNLRAQAEEYAKVCLGQRDELRAALEQIRKTPIMPFPDPFAHSERAFAEAVHTAWSRIQQIAAEALAPKTYGKALDNLLAALEQIAGGICTASVSHATCNMKPEITRHCATVARKALAGHPAGPSDTERLLERAMFALQYTSQHCGDVVAVREYAAQQYAAIAATKGRKQS